MLEGRLKVSVFCVEDLDLREGGREGGRDG
jgi:hypothetical protein